MTDRVGQPKARREPEVEPDQGRLELDGAPLPAEAADWQPGSSHSRRLTELKPLRPLSAGSQRKCKTGSCVICWRRQGAW